MALNPWAKVPTPMAGDSNETSRSANWEKEDSRHQGEFREESGPLSLLFLHQFRIGEVLVRRAEVWGSFSGTKSPNDH